MSEETKTSPTTTVRSLQFLLKVVELCLAILCVGLIVDPINHKMQLNMHHVAVVYGTYASYILINTVVILGQTRKEHIPRFMWVLFTLAGGALFIATGSVIIDDWRNLWDRSKHMGYSKQYMDMMIASGVISIFNAFVYLSDCVFTIAYG